MTHQPTRPKFLTWQGRTAYENGDANWHAIDNNAANERAASITSQQPPRSTMTNEPTPPAAADADDPIRKMIEEDLADAETELAEAIRLRDTYIANVVAARTRRNDRRRLLAATKPRKKKQT